MLQLRKRMETTVEKGSGVKPIEYDDPKAWQTRRWIWWCAFHDIPVELWGNFCHFWRIAVVGVTIDQFFEYKFDRRGWIRPVTIFLSLPAIGTAVLLLREIFVIGIVEWLRMMGWFVAINLFIIGYFLAAAEVANITYDNAEMIWYTKEQREHKQKMSPLGRRVYFLISYALAPFILIFLIGSERWRRLGNWVVHTKLFRALAWFVGAVVLVVTYVVAKPVLYLILYPAYKILLVPIGRFFKGIFGKVNDTSEWRPIYSLMFGVVVALTYMFRGELWDWFLLHLAEILVGTAAGVLILVLILLGIAIWDTHLRDWLKEWRKKRKASRPAKVSEPATTTSSVRPWWADWKDFFSLLWQIIKIEKEKTICPPVKFGPRVIAAAEEARKLMNPSPKQEQVLQLDD